MNSAIGSQQVGWTYFWCLGIALVLRIRLPLLVHDRIGWKTFTEVKLREKSSGASILDAGL